MNIKEGFVLRTVMGETVVVPIGETSEKFHGMIKLNETGAHIWRGVADGLSEDEIAKSLMEKYEDVDYETALRGTQKIIGMMKDEGILE